MGAGIINYIDLGLLIIILIILIGLLLGIYWVYQRVLYYLGIWDSLVANFNTEKDIFHAEYGYIRNDLAAIGTNIQNIEDKLNNISFRG